QDLARWAAASPKIRTTFLGFQNQRQLSRFYHAADLLVLPSRASETWGLVVNEALHHGVPCVVSDRVGCATDLIEEGITGHSCRADSSAALADALEAATTLVGRDEVRRGCRTKVAGYSAEVAAAGIAEAYFMATRTGKAA
ncbi:MAG: glycosyltransferase, partial [Vicinamibacterales bacterium]